MPTMQGPQHPFYCSCSWNNRNFMKWKITHPWWGSHSRSFDNTPRNVTLSLRWRHNDHTGVSNHQPHGCLLNRLFMRKSKKTSKLRVTGLCVGNSPGTGEFPAQMASYAENVSIWWRHHVSIHSLIDVWHHEEFLQPRVVCSYNTWHMITTWQHCTLQYIA